MKTEDAETIKARSVGQAVADGHDAFIRDATRPLGKNPAMISDDAWLVWIGRAAIKAVSMNTVEALRAELRRYSTGDNRTEYGRGWNCAMEEAEAIVERIIGEPPIQSETTT